MCFYSSTQPAKRANAIFLISAWQILFLKRSPSQAYNGFLVNPETGESTAILSTNDTTTNTPSTNPTADETVPPQQGATGLTEQDLIHAANSRSLPPISQSQGAVTIAPLPPFHDASPVACTYELSVMDCLEGMVKAMQLGFWSLDDFDLDEYEHFEQVEVSLEE